MEQHFNERMRYRVITGAPDVDFYARVSEALDEGYELYGSPSIAPGRDGVLVAQAVVLPAYEAVRVRSSSTQAEPVK